MQLPAKKVQYRPLNIMYINEKEKLLGILGLKETFFINRHVKLSVLFPICWSKRFWGCSKIKLESRILCPDLPTLLSFHLFALSFGEQISFLNVKVPFPPINSFVIHPSIPSISFSPIPVCVCYHLKWLQRVTWPKSRFFSSTKVHSKSFHVVCKFVFFSFLLILKSVLFLRPLSLSLSSSFNSNPVLMRLLVRACLHFNGPFRELNFRPISSSSQRERERKREKRRPS